MRMTAADEMEHRVSQSRPRTAVVVVTVTTVMIVIVGMLVGRMRLLVRGPLHLVTHDAISVDGWPRHEDVIGKPRSFDPDRWRRHG
jgi:hypothetical protein